MEKQMSKQSHPSVIVPLRCGILFGVEDGLLTCI